MTYTQQAIEKAIEGGWKDTNRFGDYEFVKVWQPTALEYRYEVKREDGVNDYISISTETFVLDPDFWRALGRSEGWRKSIMMKARLIDFHCLNCGADEKDIEVRMEEVKYHQYRLVDHLADGGDIESFFKELLDNK